MFERRFPLSAALAGALLAMVATACGDDGHDHEQPDAMGSVDAADDTPDAPPGVCGVTPGTWSAPDFEANAADALTLRASLDNLAITIMRGAEQETVTVDELTDLTGPYEAGTPSLASVTTAGFEPILQDAFADFVAAVLVGPQDLVDDNGNWTPGEDGGIFGTRTIATNTGGIEVRQIVDKGMMSGGAMYAYALSLTEGTIDEGTIDALAAAWGTDAALDPENRTDAANYSYGMGYHAPIAEALTAAKAYAADGDCTAERDAAIVEFFRTWELAMIARGVYYANAGADGLAAATNDDERADALHEAAEGWGLITGFYGFPDPASGPLAGEGAVATDAAIEAMMTAVGIDISDLSASMVYTADPAAWQTGVDDLEAEVIDAYGVTEAEIAAWRTPTGG